MTSSGFDALEASCNAIVLDTFAAREDSGETAKVAFNRPNLAAFSTDYIVTQQPTVQAVDFDGDDLSRAEQATIEAPRGQFPCDTLPEDCLVELPGSGTWSIDKMRGTVFGPNWVTVYLSRKPQLKQTARRLG